MAFKQLANRAPLVGESSVRRRWLVIGLTTFLALDVVLIGWALAQNDTTPVSNLVVSTSPGPEPTSPSPEPAPSESPAPSATPSASPTPQADAVPPTRLLSALNGTVAWRSNVGSCPSTPPTPELTTDGGATWTPSNLNAPTDATAIVRIRTLGTELATMVALTGADCAPEFVQTYVGGDNWAVYPDLLAGAWFVNPANRASVHSPQGDRAAPCPSVVDLAGRDETSAAVLCSDHTVFRTTDAGSTWGSSVAVPGSVALASSGNGYAIVTTEQPSCAGVQLLALPEVVDGSELTASGCFPTTATPDSLAGNIAVSEGDGTVWLWAGDSLVRSSDGGATWQ